MTLTVSSCQVIQCVGSVVICPWARGNEDYQSGTCPLRRGAGGPGDIHRLFWVYIKNHMGPKVSRFPLFVLVLIFQLGIGNLKAFAGNVPPAGKSSLSPVPVLIDVYDRSLAGGPNSLPLTTAHLQRLYLGYPGRGPRAPSRVTAIHIQEPLL